MAVKIGHARYDENGKAYGGQAGDQTGREVCISDWYKNAKGWVLLRAVPTGAGDLIAYAMERACANDRIGYDQYQRLTLYNAAKPLGFDPGKVTVACETDCSALVRVCMAHAGIHVPNFRTIDQAKILLASGHFDKLTYKTYTERDEYLRRGDILVTQTSGHTVVVLGDGGKAHTLARPYLCRGDAGPVVKTLQNLLKARGYALPKYGADGDFGAETEAAVTLYQTARGLEVDGIVGAKTWAALLETVAVPTYRVIVSGLDATVAANMSEELRRGGFKVVSEVER